MCERVIPPVMEFYTRGIYSYSARNQNQVEVLLDIQMQSFMATLFLCKFNLAFDLYIDLTRLFNVTDLLRPVSRE